MTHENRSRRVTWRVVRRDKGWLAVVLLGEDPVTFGPPTDKPTARCLARRRAAEFRTNQGR